MYHSISRCRICGNTDLVPVLDLGEQMLTGVFPRERNAKVTTGPLRLVKCSADDGHCGLLQLEAFLRPGRDVWRELRLPLGSQREHGAGTCMARSTASATWSTCATATS